MSHVREMASRPPWLQHRVRQETASGAPTVCYCVLSRPLLPDTDRPEPDLLPVNWASLKASGQGTRIGLNYP